MSRELRCPACRLLWSEARGPGDSPVHHQAFLCPRCGVAGHLLPTTEEAER